MAGPTGLLNIVMGGEDGRPGHEGRDFVMYLWLEGGWGGRLARKDNAVAMTTFATTATNQPVELHERLCPGPLRLPTGSSPTRPAPAGIAGRRASPVAGRSRTATCCCPTSATARSSGRGGSPAGATRDRTASSYAPGTDEELNVGMFRTNLPVRAGRMLDCFQPGGGGYGDPLARPVEYVVDDVIDGFVTVEGAERDYGVAIVDRPADGRARRRRGAHPTAACRRRRAALTHREPPDGWRRRRGPTAIGRSSS